MQGNFDFPDPCHAAQHCRHVLDHWVDAQGPKTAGTLPQDRAEPLDKFCCPEIIHDDVSKRLIDCGAFQFLICEDFPQYVRIRFDRGQWLGEVMSKSVRQIAQDRKAMDPREILRERHRAGFRGPPSVNREVGNDRSAFRTAEGVNDHFKPVFLAVRFTAVLEPEFRQSPFQNPNNTFQGYSGLAFTGGLGGLAHSQVVGAKRNFATVSAVLPGKTQPVTVCGDDPAGAIDDCDISNAGFECGGVTVRIDPVDGALAHDNSPSPRPSIQPGKPVTVEMRSGLASAVVLEVHTGLALPRWSRL